MNNLQLTYWNKKLIGITESLKKNRFNVYTADNCETAKNTVFSLIPENSNIGLGGSQTLIDLNIIKDFQSRNYKIINPVTKGISYETALEQRRQALLSDVFICSSNAVTQDGFLVNIDHLSNRVAAMMFGPKKVIIIAGINKIVENAEAALKKIRNYTAPQNAMRLNRNTPCAHTGVCSDCSSPDRICNNTVIMGCQKDAERIHIILVKEILGI